MGRPYVIVVGIKVPPILVQYEVTYIVGLLVALFVTREDRGGCSLGGGRKETSFEKESWL